MVSPKFELATLEVEKVNKPLSNDDLLELYALYKIATGADFGAATAPGMFDLKGKAKYNAWKKEVDDGTDAAQAEQKYIAKVNALKESNGFDAQRTTHADGKPIDAAKLKRFQELSS